MSEEEKRARVNKRFALTYLSILISVQIAGILFVLHSPSFQTILIAAVVLGTVWPLVLHQILYRVVLKRWVSRISNS